MVKYIFTLFVALYTFSAQAQVSGTKTIGTTGDYATLTAAFSAINSLGISAPVLLELQSNYNPASETYPIAPGILSGTSAIKTVTVRPATGVGNILFSASTSQVWNLNGTKYLTIEGRAGGIGSSVVTIRNTLSTGQALRFINDAAYNTVNFIIAESNNSNFNGVIIFSTSTGTIGNSFNTISNCDVRNRSDIAGNPAVLVYSAGTTASPNASNTITNNNLFNANQRGIYFVSAGLGNNWVILNNSFYHTGGLVSSTWYGLHISAGTGFSIAGNYIGGTAPMAAGTAFENAGVVTNSFQFIGMALFFGNGAVNTVQNNVIKNHNLISTGITYGGGIGVFSGTCDVIGNTIENISSSHGGQFISIQYTGSGNISNNIITGITKTNTSDWYGILAANSPNVTINGNTINNNTSTTAGDMYGIYAETSQANITSNNINNISATSAAPGNFYGIMASGNFPINISRNKIYNVGATASSVSNNVTGIYYPGFGGSTQPITISNNMVTLGNGITGTSQYKGIHDAGLLGNNVNSFYNSVLIDGSSPGGNTSYAFVKTGASNEVHRNNIYFNNRTNVADEDYAISFEDISGSIFSNYNLLVAPISTIGKWGSSSYNFSNYKSNVFKDTSSYSVHASEVPASSLFTNKNIGDLNINTANAVSWYVNGKGIAGLTSGNILTDNSGNVRAAMTGTPTDIGAHEFSTSTTPLLATALAAPAFGATTTYTFGGRKLGEITWGNSGTLPTSVEWKYFSGNPSGATVAKINSYANITAIGGTGYTYDLKLYFTEAENNNLQDNDLAMLKKESAVWNFMGSPTNNTDAAGKYLITSGQTFNSISDFSLGLNTPLPLVSINIIGKREAGFNKISWTIISDNNISGYEVERSPDGRSFIVVGSVHANNKNEYNYHDGNFTNAKLYYRIRQIAIDGSSKLSNIISLSGDKINRLTIAGIYPNPVSEYVNVAIESIKKENVSLSVIDNLGRILFTKPVIVLEGVQVVQLPVSQLPTGLYHVQLTGKTSSKSSTITFVKQ